MALGGFCTEWPLPTTMAPAAARASTVMSTTGTAFDYSRQEAEAASQDRRRSGVPGRRRRRGPRRGSRVVPA